VGTVSGLGGTAALITGASSGIGRAIALRFAAEGARVALVARRRGALEALASECGETALVLPLDLTDEGACGEAVARCVTEFGRIDSLVTAAGLARSQAFLRTDSDLWRATMQLNVDAAFWLIRAALPGMLERGEGSVITIGSTASLAGARYISAYTASKHALLGLTRALAAEYAASGVTFNCICPGYAATPMTEATLENIAARTGRTREQALAAILPPSGRLVEPDEVAAVCALIASGAVPSVNGAAIALDGGPRG
jgi:NAD(P)-dependent dehydrogenase (short-subunit alcohol dehydrogenase family)